jgi:hypothetical protein
MVFGKDMLICFGFVVKTAACNLIVSRLVHLQANCKQFYVLVDEMQVILKSVKQYIL